MRAAASKKLDEARQVVARHEAEGRARREAEEAARRKAEGEARRGATLAEGDAALAATSLTTSTKEIEVVQAVRHKRSPSKIQLIDELDALALERPEALTEEELLRCEPAALRQAIRAAQQAGVEGELLGVAASTLAAAEAAQERAAARRRKELREHAAARPQCRRHLVGPSRLPGRRHGFVSRHDGMGTAEARLARG